MQANNPFFYHAPVPPADFVGRESALELIFNQLRSHGRANIALHGTLGVGKTSLLNYITDPEVVARWGLDPQKFLFCAIDCQSLAGDFTPDRFWRRLLRHLLRQVDGELQALIQDLIAQEDVNFEDIQDVLDDLDWAERVVVVLLDEFEVVFRTHTELAEQATKNLLGKLSALGRHNHFMMVTATQKALIELVRELETWRGSPFPAVFMHQELSAFTQGEADELFDRALAGTDVTFSGDERRHLYEETDGHPARLQAASAALFDGKQRDLTGDDLWDFVQERLDNSYESNAHAATGGLRMDDTNDTVWMNGQLVEGLSNKEFSLLQYLYSNAGRVCQKEDIWEAVWPEYDEEGMADYPIQKLVSRLRGKIEPNPERPRYILTVWGRGYKLVPN